MARAKWKRYTAFFDIRGREFKGSRYVLPTEYAHLVDVLGSVVKYGNYVLWAAPEGIWFNHLKEATSFAWSWGYSPSAKILERWPTPWRAEITDTEEFEWFETEREAKAWVKKKVTGRR